MKATAALHNLGQSIWLDNITRDLLKTGVGVINPKSAVLKRASWRVR